MHKTGKRIAISAAVLIVVFSVAAFGFDRYVLSMTYKRHVGNELALLPSYSMYEKDYPRTDEQFQLDGRTLRGHVYGADNNRALVIFRHGIFSKHEDYLPFITSMVDRGYRVFAYDAIGCGESDGDNVLGMSQSPIDVAAAIDFARESGMCEGMPIALWGHSWGGYGVAAALASRPDVDACVTMSGFDTPVKVLVSSATGSYGPIGVIQEPFLWLNTVIDFGNAANVSASDAVASSGVPTFVIHGIGDTTVVYEGVSILDNLQNRLQNTAEGKVVFKTLADEGRDGHNDYFYTRECQAYRGECAAELQALLDENGDDAGAEEVKAFLASVDMRKANTADPALVDEIDAFLTSQLGLKPLRTPSPTPSPTSSQTPSPTPSPTPSQTPSQS